ncbi:MAG: AzlD domain-containing protein [Neisseriaceae bacterium]|nr:AzlD domain-containing protein [Neisseriaceae bacterium]
MNTTLILAGTVCMGVITFLLRAFPTLVPKAWLRSRLLSALNFALPISVMVVLILASLSLSLKADTFAWPRLSAEVLALATVLLTYVFWRNVFISVIVGVASLNGFIWLLGA